MKKTKLYVKALSALFAFLMCFSCFTSFPLAAATPTLSVVAGEVKAGEEITVSINMSGNPGIAGMNAYVSYDSSVLTPVAANQGSALSGAFFSTNFASPTFKASDEQVAFTMYGASNSTNNGSFFTITFKVKSGIEDVSSLITLNCTDVTNQDFDDVSVKTVNGSVKVVAGDEKDDDKDDDKADETTQSGSIKLRTKASKIKYMAGRSSDKFEPDANATRYEVLDCFYELFDVDYMATDKGFKDVSPQYKSKVNLFATAGVVSGYTDGTFKGDNTITRAEFCVFIVNLMGLDISKAKDQGFPDVKGSNWYVPYVNAVAKAGYVKGRDTGMFDPNGLITRAEVATLINRITGVDVDAATTCIYGDVSPKKWYFKQVAAAAK